MSWTTERLERAITLWKDGHSAGSIADRLGGVSRNAVLGKLWRKGYRKDRQLIHQRRAAGLLRRHKHKRPPTAGFSGSLTSPRRSARTDLPLIGPPRLPAAPLPPEPPAVATRTIATLEGGDCRWPIGEPRAADFGFCGCPVAPGRSYCPAHLARAYDVLPGRGRRGAQVPIAAVGRARGDVAIFKDVEDFVGVGA